MKKRILATLLTLVMLLGLMPLSAFAEGVSPVEITPNYEWYGDGTAAEFTISTVEDLAGLAKLTQGNVMVNETTLTKTDFAGKTVKLGASLTFADYQYLYYRNSDSTFKLDYQIGSFAGVFDGQGNTITGLKFYNADISQNSYMYLFNVITATGSIKDITLDTVTADINGGDYFGFLAKTLNGTATNCHVNNATANVVVNNSNKAYLCQTAAMFGYVYSATISDCTVSNFKINAPNGVDTTDRVGALIGQSNGSAADLVNGIAAKPTTVTNCSVSDVVFDLAYKTKKCGGFVGSTDNTSIVDCTATDISISVGSYYQHIGGFVGTVGFGSTFTKCTVDKIVIDADSTDIGGYIGGFSASVSGDKISFAECSVTDLDMDVELRYKDYGYIGGFSSSVDGSGTITFEKCSASGDIFAEDYDSNSPTGGFFGYTGNGNLTVNECVANVDVTTPYAAGGFIGKSNAGTFIDCEANGAVSGDTAGGFVGEIVPNSSNAALIIDTCESNGAVTGGTVASGFVGSLTTANENDANATTVTITNSTTKSEVTGTQDTTEIIEFAKESVMNGSHAHYESSGNKAFHKFVTCGDRRYYSFREALEEAESGDTIALIGDVEEYDIEIAKNIIIDLGGNTLAGNFIVKSTATFENGTVDVTASGVNTVALDSETDVIAVDGGAAIIESGTYNGVLSTSNDGTITINAGTFSENPTAYLADGLTATQTNTGWVVGDITEASFVVSANKTEVATGDEVTVTVNLNGENLVGGKWKLTFEDDKFEPVGTGSLSGEWESAGNPTNSKKLATYTFKALAQDNESIEARFSITDEDAWDYNGAMTGRVNATVEPVDVDIVYNTMDVSVSVNDEEQTDDSKSIEWNGSDYKIKINAPTTAEVVTSVKIDGVDAENNLTFNLPGTYEVTYTVTEKGYETVAGKFTLTINALDMAAPVKVNGVTDENVTKEVTYTEVDSYTITIDAPEGATTALELNDAPATADHLTFNMPGTYKIDYTVTKTGYKTITGTYTLVINKATMTVPVSVNGTEQTETSNSFDYITGGYTVAINPSVTDTAISYKVNGANGASLTFVNAGTYEITYTVTKTGYEDVSGAFTLTINEIDYVVEVNLTDADTADYVAGKKIVLVYTDNEYVSFTYGGKTMFDVSSREYQYNGETAYAKVFAIVVDSIDTDESTEGAQAELSDYEANVRLVKSELAENYVVNYSTDLNKDNELTLRDVSVAYGVVNQYEPYFIDFMANVLMADTNGDKVADDQVDAPFIYNEYTISKNK